MLKKQIFKKLSIILAALIVILIICIFPDKNIKYEIVNNSNVSGVIYLLNRDNLVSRLDIIYSSSNNKDLVKEIIDLLTINETISIREGFYPLIPSNTKLLNLNIKNNILTLNFSKEFLNTNKDTEEKMIEAIIYSITENLDIRGISIFVENEHLDKLPISNKKLPSILDRSFKVNKVYDVTSLDNIKATTIFYTAREDNFFYHIPVTKYTNDSKEKIEIIIDELKSSSTISNGVINYIHEETELIDYQLLDKSLLVNFNNKLFADISNDNIIEEVTYSINLSIKENYDVDTVMYTIDDSFYNNYFLFLG